MWSITHCSYIKDNRSGESSWEAELDKGREERMEGMGRERGM